MFATIHPDTPPAGYPAELEQDVVLSDGMRLHLRPIVPADAALLADEILAADSETLYLRFFTTNVVPDKTLLEALTVMDYRSRLAVGLITESGVAIGIARYAAIDETNVEVAIAVKTQWRRRGIAHKLLDVVESAAAARGFGRAHALYLSHNKPAQELFAARGYRVESIESAIIDTTLDLNRTERTV